jgi:hypothetical protein
MLSIALGGEACENQFLVSSFSFLEEAKPKCLKLAFWLRVHHGERCPAHIEVSGL